MHAKYLNRKTNRNKIKVKKNTLRWKKTLNAKWKRERKKEKKKKHNIHTYLLLRFKEACVGFLLWIELTITIVGFFSIFPKSIQFVVVPYKLKLICASESSINLVVLREFPVLGIPLLEQNHFLLQKKTKFFFQI